MLIGFYKDRTNDEKKKNGATTPTIPPVAPPSPSLAHAAAQIESILVSLITSFTSTIKSDPTGTIASSIGVATMRVLIATFTCHGILAMASTLHISQVLTDLHAMCQISTVSSDMRSLLFTLLHDLTSRLHRTDDDMQPLFKSVTPHFHFLLTTATTLTPQETSTTFDSFRRVTLECTAFWTSRLKDLIPVEVHPRVVAYVRSKGNVKPQPTKRLYARQNMVHGNNDATLTNSSRVGSPGQPPSSPTSIDVSSDVQRWSDESTRRQQELHAISSSHPAEERRQARLQQLLPAVTFAAQELGMFAQTTQ